MFTQSDTKKTGMLALLLGLVFAAGCGGGDSAADSAPAAGGSSTAAAAAPAADAGAQESEGERVYGSVCVTCHQPNGEGLQGAFPPLAGSAVAVGDADVPIQIVLHGLTGEMTRGGNTYNGMMTPWASSLSDSEVASVLTYVRSSFGNEAGAVTAEQVAAVRSASADQTSPYTTDGLGISGE